MEIILRVLQVFLAVGLIGVVLLQRSEGGGLGIGSSGGAGSFMSVRGTANFLTRVTAILGALFMIICLILTLLAKPTTVQKSIFDTPAPVSTTVPAPTPVPAQTQTLPVPAAPVSQAPALPIPVPGEKADAPVTTSPAPAPTAVAPAAEPAPAAKAKKAPQTGPAHKPGQ
jgi:preprotein translocase subunit SecG